MAEADDGAPKAAPKSKRLQQTQAQVDEVVDIMKMNIDKVLERDQKLSQLDDRADALQEGASQFEKSAGTLKNKMMWKNMKMIIIMVVVGLIFLFIMFLYMGGDPADLNPAKIMPKGKEGEKGGGKSGEPEEAEEEPEEAETEPPVPPKGKGKGGGGAKNKPDKSGG